jgi:formate dehydrogenase major subunit
MSKSSRATRCSQRRRFAVSGDVMASALKKRFPGIFLPQNPTGNAGIVFVFSLSVIVVSSPRFGVRIAAAEVSPVKWRLPICIQYKEAITMQINRRQFFKVCSGGMAGTTLVALGFAPGMALAQARQHKLLRAREIRNTCPYCSVGCGLLMYSKNSGSGNAKDTIFHIEGDPDHPVSRGALCPKGAGLVDFIHSDDRLRYPEVREPGTNRWKRISWDEALSRIARHIKEDRDANFVERNAEGVTVNRLPTLSLMACTSITNEVGFLTQKLSRALGLVHVDCIARV